MATKNDGNQESVATMDDRVEALSLAHVLVEAGLDASVTPLYVVTVRHDELNRAHNVIFLRQLEAAKNGRGGRRRRAA